MLFSKKSTSLLSCLTLVFSFLLSTMLYANESSNGFALSAGNLSPVNVGILDEGHSQMGVRMGYRIGRLQPFGFVDFARGTLYDEVSYEEGEKNNVTKNTTDNDASLTLITAGAGLKFLLNEAKAKSAQAYLVGSVFTVIPMTKGNDLDLKILDKSSSLGALVGFGTQYSFSKHFSLGIELGLSYFNASYTNTNDDSYSTYIYRQTETVSASLWQIYHMIFMEIVL